MPFATTSTETSAPHATCVGARADQHPSQSGLDQDDLLDRAQTHKDTITRPLVERLLVSAGGEPDDRHTRSTSITSYP